MSNSLRDQLLQAGLVSKKQVQEAQTKKKRTRKQKRAKGQSTEDVTLAEAYARKAKEEKRERDRELNAKLEEERRNRERKAKLRELVKGQAKNDKKAEIQRNFEHRGKIRRVYVTETQQTAINAGQLAVVWVDNRYLLIEASVAEKVRETSERALALWVDPKAQDDEADYSDPKFQVPDDLMW